MADERERGLGEPAKTQERIREAFRGQARERSRPPGVTPEWWDAYRDLKEDSRIMRKGRVERRRAGRD